MDDRTELPEESDTAITTFPEVRSASSTETTEVSLSIAGMTCGACAALIQRRLNALDGVEATVNYATERARVFLPMSTTADTLVDAVESAGYSAEILGDGGVADGSDEDDQRVHFLGRRLLVSALLFMPLCDLSLIFSLIPVTRFPYWQWLLVVLAAPVLTWAAWPFYRAAFRLPATGRRPWTPWCRWASWPPPAGRCTQCSGWTPPGRRNQRSGVICPPCRRCHLPRCGRRSYHVSPGRTVLRGVVEAPDRQRPEIIGRGGSQGCRRDRRVRDRDAVCRSAHLAWVTGSWSDPARRWPPMVR